MSKVELKYVKVERHVHFNFTRNNGSGVEGVLIIKEHNDGTTDFDIQYFESSNDPVTREELELILRTYDTWRGEIDVTSSIEKEYEER
jgi:hypothetical protein